MSGHEHERLSAYLDGELGASERDELALHLASCAECAARLAELAAVDDAARALAADAPPGYFDALPGRVRARLGPRAPARRLPAWGWAVAAALLLAVVTPLTWRAAAPQLGPPAGPAALAPRPTALPAANEPPVEATRAASNAAPKPAGAPAPLKEQARKSGEGFAAAPAGADRELPATDTLQRREPAAPPAPAARSYLPPAAGALARADAVPAQPERSAAEVRDSRARENVAAREAAAAPAEQKAAAAPEPQAQAALAASGAGARIEERVAAASTPVTDDEWRRLASTHPQSAEEWRRLREELRRFAEAWPEGPHAAAARLRVVEAGHSAWRASGNPADEAAFRADAQAYLEREDARDADKARVRRLLR